MKTKLNFKLATIGIVMGLLCALSVAKADDADVAKQVATNYAATLIKIAKSRPDVVTSKSMDFQDFCDLLSDRNTINSDWFQSQMNQPLGASQLDKNEALGYIAAWTLNKMDFMSGLRQNLSVLNVYGMQAQPQLIRGVRIQKVSMKLRPDGQTLYLFVDSSGHIYNLGNDKGTVLEHAPNDLSRLAQSQRTTAVAAESQYVTGLLQGSPHAADYQGCCPDL